MTLKIITFLSRVFLGRMCFLSIVGIIFLVAFITRFMLLPIPFTGPDSIGYLGVAFKYLDDGIFVGIAERSFLYPGFLTVLLNLYNTVCVIPVMQHIIGLVGGIIFLYIWKISQKMFFSLSYIYLRVYWIIGVFGLTILLFSPWTVDIESWTHPESINTTLILLGILLYLKFYQVGKKQIKVGFSKMFVWSAFFFFFNYLLFVFQPRYGITVLFGLSLFLFGVLKYKVKVVQKLGIILGSFLITYLLFLPFSHYDYRDAVNLNRTKTFFFVNLNSIIPIIKQDIDDQNFISQDKELLRKLVIEYDYSTNKEKASKIGIGWFDTLGYNADYLNLGEASDIVSTHFGRNMKQSKAFYEYYLKRAILEKPFGLIAKVTLEMKYFYCNSQRFYIGLNNDSKQNWNYSYETVQGFQKHFHSKALYDYITYLETAREFDINVAPFLFENISKVLYFLNMIFVPVNVMFLIVLISNIWFKKEYLPFGVFVFAILIIGLCINLTASIGLSIVVTRYVFDQFANILLFEISALAYIIIFVLTFIQKLLIRVFGDNTKAIVIR